MQITLISQCSKNALPRTRMVLDAFAERIGDNAWQTIITKEGLDALHTELRKTASKSTAVACHWQRSRTRSQLLWIVGKKHEFNANGNVPVNETSEDTDQFMDTKNDNILYANTSKQTLKEHLSAVAQLATIFIEKLIPDSESNKTSLKKAVYIAGLFHDLGKIDPQFQEWIFKKRIKKNIEEVNENGVHIDSPAKFSFEKHPRHIEISLLLYGLIQNANSVIWGNPYVRETLESGEGRTKSFLTKASGVLSINLDISIEKAKELRQMIDDAAVSSFYLGKKGLAYVTKITI